MATATFQHFDLSFQIIKIYGPSSTQEKRVLWEHVSQIMQEHAEENFILAGDFNAIVSHEEKKGGICPPPRAIVDFQNFISDNQLIDIIPSQGKFTWTNRRQGFYKLLTG